MNLKIIFINTETFFWSRDAQKNYFFKNLGIKIFSFSQFFHSGRGVANIFYHGEAITDSLRCGLSENVSHDRQRIIILRVKTL